MKKIQPSPTDRPAIVLIRGLVLTLMLLCSGGAFAQYAVGDYGSIASGAWNGATTWGIWNGATFTPTAVTPPLASTAWIRNGHTVHLPAGGPYSITNLTVQAGGKLWSQNAATNVYLQIYGTTLRCDGVIGDGNNFDGISFNIEGANVTIQGTGTFDCSRLRKNTAAPNNTTNVVIAMNMNIRFQSGSTTQMYNNVGASSFFNVTVNAGVTVNLVGTSGTGNLAIDGINGAVAGNAAGAYVVNGTINMNGILYLTSNNGAGFPCSVTINNGGLIRCNQVAAPASANATGGHSFTINNGGRLEIQGTPTAWTAFSQTNNSYSFAVNSTVEYSGLGPQTVECGITTPLAGYGNLRISGSGTKSLNNVLAVRGNVDIVNSSGAPTLDVTLSSFAMNVGGNWTNYAPTGFNERFGQVNFNGTGAQSITTAGGEVFYNLRLVKTAGTTLSMASNVNVNSNLVFANGILDLNSNTLTLQNGATTAISGATAARYILSEDTDNSSKVVWNIGTSLGAHVVPFGLPTGYIPFTFNLVLGDAGLVTMSTYGTGQNNLPWPVTPTTVTNLTSSVTGLDNSDATVDRFWQVDVTGGSAISTLTFTYRSAELPVAPYNNPSSLRAQLWTSPNNTWNPPTGAQSGIAYSVTADSQAAFGPFTLAPIESLLPVELLRFDARAQDEDVLVEWITASELNNDHFTIERSADGLHFEEIGTVDGAGNSQVTTTYSWIDRKPLAGNNYYRLRQTDLDGTSTLSDVVLVTFDTEPGWSEVSAWPNPATGPVTITLPVTDVLLELTVLDPIGRVVRSIPVSSNAASVSADLSELPNGTYHLRLTGADRVRTIPLVVAH